MKSLTLLLFLAVTPALAQMSPNSLVESGTIGDWWAADPVIRQQASGVLIKKVSGREDSEAAMALEKCISDATQGKAELKTSKVIDIALSCEGG
ncbi:MAG: hypothetical protein ACR2OW_03440 [Methyloligellaceae bacterium]